MEAKQRKQSMIAKEALLPSVVTFFLHPMHQVASIKKLEAPRSHSVCIRLKLEAKVSIVTVMCDQLLCHVVSH